MHCPNSSSGSDEMKSWDSPRNAFTSTLNEVSSSIFRWWSWRNTGYYKTHVDKSWQVSFFNWRMVLRSIRKVDLRREKHRRDVTSSSASRFCRGTFWLELHKHTSYQLWRRCLMSNVNHIFDLQSEPPRNHLFFLNQTNRFFRQLLEVLQLQKQSETGRLQTFLTFKNTSTKSCNQLKHSFLDKF